MDRLSELQVFRTVADELSFARAARRLNMSPAAVTRAIARLEGRVRTSLLHRTTRAVALTDEGSVFLGRAAAVLSAFEDAERTFEERDEQPSGQIVITAPVTFGRLHVVPMLATLMAEHQLLSVRLHLVDRNVRLIEEGIDLAFRIGEPADSSLAILRLTGVRSVFVASPGYLAAHGRPANAADLRGHDLIQFEGLDRSTEWRFAGKRRSYARFKPRLVVNNADAALAAAQAGLGIARLLSYQVANPIREGHLTPVMVGIEAPALPVALLFEGRRRGSRTIRAVIDAARTYFAGIDILE